MRAYGQSNTDSACRSNLRVSSADFVHAMSSIVPSAQREVHVSVPRVTWDDIGGLSDVKRVLVEAIEWPLQHRGTMRAHTLTHVSRKRYAYTPLPYSCPHSCTHRRISAPGHHRVARNSTPRPPGLLQDHASEGSGVPRQGLVPHLQWRRHLRSLSRRSGGHTPRRIQESTLV